MQLRLRRPCWFSKWTCCSHWSQRCDILPFHCCGSALSSHVTRRQPRSPRNGVHPDECDWCEVVRQQRKLGSRHRTWSDSLEQQRMRCCNGVEPRRMLLAEQQPVYGAPQCESMAGDDGEEILLEQLGQLQWSSLDDAKTRQERHSGEPERSYRAHNQHVRQSWGGMVAESLITAEKENWQWKEEW